MVTSVTQARTQADAPPGGLLRMEEAIAALKTTRPTFYRWLRDGKIKAFKVGRQWRFRKDDIERFLQGRQPRIDLPVSPGPLVAELKRKLRDLGRKDTVERFQNQDDPLALAACLLFRLASAQRASDIHMGPHFDGKEHSALIRNRIDGVLSEAAKLDLRLLPALVERFKTLGGMNPAETKLPQDGRILIRDGDGRDLDIRVSTVPTIMGESVTCRLLVPGEISFDIKRFGYAERDEKCLVESARLPHGLVIIAGPTGCGKTTTLYSCLSMAAGPGVKTMTVEDPVEYMLPWMVQIGLHESAGLSFERAIRSILRSDPDVVMVGEIRNSEIANLCVQVALTGHLVYTTLHCTSAVQSLGRMVDIGVPPFVLADAASLVVAQLLVRRLCPKCSKPAKLTREEQLLVDRLAAEGGISPDTLPGNYRQAVGCKDCGRQGYRGRSVIAEALQIGPAVSKALRAGAPAEELRRAAIADGMTTMAADGARKAAEGVTTLEEVRRVLSLGAVG